VNVPSAPETLSREGVTSDAQALAAWKSAVEERFTRFVAEHGREPGDLTELWSDDSSEWEGLLNRETVLNTLDVDEESRSVATLTGVLPVGEWMLGLRPSVAAAIARARFLHEVEGKATIPELDDIPSYRIRLTEENSRELRRFVASLDVEPEEHALAFWGPTKLRFHIFGDGDIEYASTAAEQDVTAEFAGAVLLHIARLFGHDPGLRNTLACAPRTQIFDLVSGNVQALSDAILSLDAEGRASANDFEPIQLIGLREVMAVWVMVRAAATAAEQLGDTFADSVLSTYLNAGA
jgi:hypothetical protein